MPHIILTEKETALLKSAIRRGYDDPGFQNLLNELDHQLKEWTGQMFVSDKSLESIQKYASAGEKPISARDGRWFTVRIMPYRTMDDRIDGVVITFANITVSKTLEGKLRDKHTLLEKHVAEDFAARAKIAKRASPEMAAHKPTRAARKTRRIRKSLSVPS